VDGPSNDATSSLPSESTKSALSKVVIIRDEASGRHWFARASRPTNSYVPFMPATQVDAAIRIGAAAWRDCPGCGHNEVVRSDDYLCTICREDPWLDLPEYIESINEQP
jgi:hypothetical protein